MTAPGNIQILESVSDPERNTGSSAATFKLIFTAEQGAYAFCFVQWCRSSCGNAPVVQ